MNMSSPAVKRKPTAAEKIVTANEKRQKILEAKETSAQEGWAFVNTAKECFFLDALPTDDAFPMFKQRVGVTFLSIFRCFVTEELIDLVKASWKPEDMFLGGKLKSGNPRTVLPLNKYIWQALAVYVRIVGRQVIRLKMHQKTTVTGVDYCGSEAF